MLPSENVYNKNRQWIKGHSISTGTNEDYGEDFVLKQVQFVARDPFSALNCKQLHKTNNNSVSLTIKSCILDFI